MSFSIIQVTLTIRNTQAVDPGLYELAYKSEDGLVSDTNRLKVQRK